MRETGRGDAPGGVHEAERRIELGAADRDALDVVPRQIARLFDPATGSEWVVDARRCGSQVQARAVEYASDGLWMPHVWRDVPADATLVFVAGHGIEVRGRGKAGGGHAG